MATVSRPSDFERLRGVRDVVLVQRDRSWVLVGIREPQSVDGLISVREGDIVLATLTVATLADVVASVESWFAEMDATTSSRPPHAGDSAAWVVAWS
jgi:hypothetical protein